MSWDHFAFVGFALCVCILDEKGLLYVCICSTCKRRCSKTKSSELIRKSGCTNVCSAGSTMQLTRIHIIVILTV